MMSSEMFLHPGSPVRSSAIEFWNISDSGFIPNNELFVSSKTDMGGECCNVVAFWVKLELMVSGCEIQGAEYRCAIEISNMFFQCWHKVLFSFHGLVCEFLWFS